MAKLFEAKFEGKLVLDQESAKFFKPLAAMADKWKGLFVRDMDRLAADAARMVEADFLADNPGFKASVEVIHREAKAVFAAAMTSKEAAA